MSVLTVAAVTSIVATGANMIAGRKRAKAQAKAAQEAAYIEGAAPVIPVANELAIDTIGDAETPETAAPDFREALEGTYGGGMYDTQDFQSGQQQQQIPPELEALLMQQQGTGMEPTNVQFARSGGPVGLPQDVYHFSVPKISQMQMDVDPGVRNVGNAMMAQMAANPGMGMVSASAADIDQMATGGPVQPKKYQDGSDGGLRGYLSMDEMPEDATDYDKLMQLQLIASEVQRNAARDPDKFTTSFASEFIEDPETGDLIPVMKGREYYGPMTNTREDKLSPDRIEEILEMVRASNRQLSDKDIEMLGLPSDTRLATGGPVQPRRYEDGSTGGIRAAVREAGLKELQALRPKNILKGATVGQIESAGDVLAAEGFKEKAVEVGDFVPGGERVNPLRHLRSLIRKIQANKEAKELEELEAEARVFGPQMSD